MIYIYKWKTKVGLHRLLAFFYIYQACRRGTLKGERISLQFPFIEFEGYEMLSH